VGTPKSWPPAKPYLGGKAGFMVRDLRRAEAAPFKTALGEERIADLDI